MKSIFQFCLISILLIACQTKSTNKSTDKGFEVGIISDCQYCFCEISGQRNYKKSPKRLEEAVKNLNQKDLKYTVHLGDFIDRDMNSFDTLMPIWSQLSSKKYHVLGNHDFEVADSVKEQVFAKMNLTEKNRYYSFKEKNWRFIVLDGNDLSFHGSLDSIKKQQTDSLYNSLLKDSLPYLQKWNGGLSNKQLSWVKNELELATKNNEYVGFYCHFPVYPLDSHNLWNTNDLLSLIDRYECVKAYFNGHNHAGAYKKVNDVHYLTFKAMVNTEDQSSYAIVSFNKDSIIIEGVGREISRKLKIN